MRRRLTIREALLAWAMLAVLGALVYSPHVAHGGYYLDDWSDAAGTFYPPGGSGVSHVLSYFSGLFTYRPVLILYVPFKYYVLGTNMAYQLVLAVALGVIVAALAYGILRTLSVPWYHAWLIAALTVVYPWFDSTRLWEAASLSTLAIAFAFGGLWIALVGLNRRSWLLHGCAAFLYLVSILAYEITLPFIAAAGVFYVFRAGWRLARTRWAVDLVVVVGAGLWDGLHTNRSVSSISGDLTHLKEIFTSGGTLLGRTPFPVGPHSHTALTLTILGIVVVAGLIVGLSQRPRFGDGPQWDLREWLLLAAGGLLVAALGWTMFIPADPYYTPSIYGFTNRVNALAGIGLVIFVYATIGIAATLAGRFLPKTRGLVTVATLVAGLMLGAAYVHVLERHGRIWDTAYRAETAAIDQMRARFPHLRHGTTVFTSNYPAYQTLGVPIFASTWDLNGMIKLRYDDGTLSAYPVIEGQQLVCRPGGVGLWGTGAPTTTSPYGAARLLDVETGRHSVPRSRKECRAVVGDYVPGPMYTSGAY